ncbi:MAG TPA: hypothetical protein VFY84_07385 [Jiangellales bacterium]|nr:hypothetical protein [Jiangellales bacterium]
MVHVGPGQRLERAGDRDAGVVDQGVEQLGELAVERGEVLGVGDVELDRRDQLGLRGQLLGGDVGADAAVHPPTRVGQADGDGAADAAAGAGHEDGSSAHAPTLAQTGLRAASSAVLESGSLA